MFALIALVLEWRTSDSDVACLFRLGHLVVDFLILNIISPSV